MGEVTRSDLHNRLLAAGIVQERAFHSHIPVIGPFIAGFRSLWNNVSTKWYVRPILQQQNEFNELVVNHLAAQDARLQDHQGYLDAQVAHLANLEARAHDHDAWLVAQDREQSELVHDLAEIRLQLVQMSRILDDLNRRVERLDSIGQPCGQGRPT